MSRDYIDIYNNLIQTLKTDIPPEKKLQLIDDLIVKFRIDYSIPESKAEIYIRRLHKHRTRIQHRMMS